MVKVHEGVTWPCTECDYVGANRVRINIISVLISEKDHLFEEKYV
jgi:hypothetical protein